MTLFISRRLQFQVMVLAVVLMTVAAALVTPLAVDAARPDATRAPSGAVLKDFRAICSTNGSGNVTIRWQTSTENGVAGYNIWRDSTMERMIPVRINDALIPATGMGGGGATYTYIDPAGTGVRWTYLLEAVRTNGMTQMFSDPDAVCTTS